MPRNLGAYARGCTRDDDREVGGQLQRQSLGEVPTSKFLREHGESYRIDALDKLPPAQLPRHRHELLLRLRQRTTTRPEPRHWSSVFEAVFISLTPNCHTSGLICVHRSDLGFAKKTPMTTGITRKEQWSLFGRQRCGKNDESTG